MFYHCKNESWKLEVCGWEYFRVHVCIIAAISQQIPGVCRTFNLNFQDFPVPKSFSRTFRSGNLTKNPWLSRRHGNTAHSSLDCFNFHIHVSTVSTNNSICRCVRSGLCSAEQSTVSELADATDESLFTQVLCNKGHELHQLLPE